MPGARAAGLRRLSLAIAFAMSTAASAAPPVLASREFVSSDGVTLHYLEGGRGRTLVFVPGWTMPGDIFRPQLEHFVLGSRVVALDPRSQGRSAIAREGHTPERRARDIAELIERLGSEPVVLIGWSLGVLESLAYVREFGDARLAGLVLIDNSVGEQPPPRSTFDMVGALRRDREKTVRNFVRAMFKQPQADAFLTRLTRDALRTPLEASIALISYPWPRERWRDALYSTRRPILFVSTPRFAEQGANVQRNHADATLEVFENAGHALFVDEPRRFNALLERFLDRL